MEGGRRNHCHPPSADATGLFQQAGLVSGRHGIQQPQAGCLAKSIGPPFLLQHSRGSRLKQLMTAHPCLQGVEVDP